MTIAGWILGTFMVLSATVGIINENGRRWRIQADLEKYRRAKRRAGGIGRGVPTGASKHLTIDERTRP